MSSRALMIALKKPPYMGNFRLDCLMRDNTVKKSRMERTLLAMGKMGSITSGMPILREAIICQKVMPIMTAISTRTLITMAKRVPGDVMILFTAPL